MVIHSKNAKTRGIILQLSGKMFIWSQSTGRQVITQMTLQSQQRRGAKIGSVSAVMSW